jgi:hypothetical protein
MTCFHIRWDNSKLDWECHGTREEAEIRARELAKPSEMFTIERFHDAEGKLAYPNLRAIQDRQQREQTV